VRVEDTIAYIEGLDGDVVDLYRRQMDEIVAHGGTPIILQTVRLRGKQSHEKVAVYRTICRGFREVLAFELAPVFAPNGEIFDDETVRGLMEIPHARNEEAASCVATLTETNHSQGQSHLSPSYFGADPCGQTHK
jgi:hypothetical protein